MKTGRIIKRLLIGFVGLLFALYAGICGLLFFYQESILFHPQKFSKDFVFDFENTFTEMNIRTRDNILLNGLLFKSKNSKGLIFYLHGNGGSLNSWGGIAKTYTDMNYDVFMLDYRGYGKSEGTIQSQDQLYEDDQTAYDSLKAIYSESDIIVLGYSIGTGLATKLASENHPKLLILQAPYFSMTDVMRHVYPFLPTFILRYPLPSNELVTKCGMPITIFHGNRDEVVNYDSSLKLKKIMKETDQLITLDGQGHNGITYNPVYISEMKRLLEK